ncbi:MAG: hypothetical protein SF097_13455 [Acidobacteriota bacterium]|nr:hypothetical protein [Acidobacteriota bacterium]
MSPFTKLLLLLMIWLDMKSLAQSDTKIAGFGLENPPWDRLLIVVYTEQDLPLYRIITVFDAEGRWIDEYYGR